MAQEYPEGSRVVILASDDGAWDGAEGELISFDSGDNTYPYLVKVEDDDGDMIHEWVYDVEPAGEQAAGEPPQMSREIFQVVRQFMQGEAAVKTVARGLAKKQAVIIKMNPQGDGMGYGAGEGPYIVIWHSQCSRGCKWASSDGYLEGTNYRYSVDGGENMRLKEGPIKRCQNYQAYLVDLTQAGELRGHMRRSLDLDGDLYSGSSTDSIIDHSRILATIKNASLATLLTEVQQQVVSPVTMQTQVSQTGESKMSNKITSIVAQAKTAAVTAGEIQAGKALNIAIIKAIKPKAPLMVRGYLDHPAAPAVVALAVVSAAEFMPAGPAKVKITKAASLMLTAAVIDGADKLLDLEGMIDKVFAGLPAEAKALLDA